MNVDEPKKSDLHLARMINHQHQIIDKIQEIAKNIEKLYISRQELKELLQKSEVDIEKGFEEITKVNRG